MRHDCFAPRAIGGFLLRSFEAGTQHRRDGREPRGGRRRHRIRTEPELVQEPGAHFVDADLHAHQVVQERAALGRAEVREPLRVEDQRQARILGEFALELAGRQHDAVRLLAACDNDLAAVGALGDERAVFLLQRDAHGVAGERHAHGLLQAALAGAVRTGEECDGFREPEVRRADPKNVRHVDVGDFHDSSSCGPRGCSTVRLPSEAIALTIPLASSNSTSRAARL